MSKRKDGQERGKYTLEFKLEAVRLVKGERYFTPKSLIYNEKLDFFTMKSGLQEYFRRHRLIGIYSIIKSGSEQ